MYDLYLRRPEILREVVSSVPVILCMCIKVIEKYIKPNNENALLWYLILLRHNIIGAGGGSDSRILYWRLSEK